jgi:hypothetical protein
MWPQSVNGACSDSGADAEKSALVRDRARPI